MRLFYSPAISGNLHLLSQEESKHCVRVLRLKKGDTVHLTDGLGNMYVTRIVDDNYNKCLLEITRTISDYGKRNFNLHMAVAPTKNLNRFEWFLEKATEIGIDTITPLICDHSERRVLQIDRQNKVITAAMKQSLKAYHPVLTEAISFQEFIHQDFHAKKFIAYSSDNYKNTLKEEYQPGTNALILIGPEGDFSTNEVESAIKMGFKPVSLGPSRLRTETAAIAACLTVNIMNL
jgi:16S rRNA (uracil1498-N3)-methyltransferase